ncbi:MAG: YggT family protein [Microbacteriaceae bacterium]
MSIFSWLATVLYYALLIFTFFMWARLIVDFVLVLRRDWRPRGGLLVLLNFVFSVTDPPLKLVRRVIKPVRFGAVALDFAWTVVLLLAIIGMYVALAFI